MDKLDNLASKKMRLAEKLSNEKKYEESLQICDEIIAQYQDYYFAYHLKCRNLYDLGKFDEAYNEIELLIRISSKPEAAYYLRAEWSLSHGEYFDVIEDANAIIQMNNEYFLNGAQFYKSLAYMSLNRKIEAMEACLKLPDDFKYGIRTKQHGFKVWTKTILEDTLNS